MWIVSLYCKSLSLLNLAAVSLLATTKIKRMYVLQSNICSDESEWLYCAMFPIKVYLTEGQLSEFPIYGQGIIRPMQVVIFLKITLKLWSNQWWAILPNHLQVLFRFPVYWEKYKKMVKVPGTWNLAADAKTLEVM